MEDREVQGYIMNAITLRQAALKMGIIPTTYSNWKAVVRKALRDEIHSKRFNSPKRELKIQRDFNEIASIRNAFGTSVSSAREFGGAFENAITGKGFMPTAIGSTDAVHRRLDKITKHFHVHPGQTPGSRRLSLGDVKLVIAALERTGQPTQETVVSLVNRTSGIGATQMKIFYKNGVRVRKALEWNPFALETFNLNGERTNLGNRVSMFQSCSQEQIDFQHELVRGYVSHQKRENDKGNFIKTREKIMFQSVTLDRGDREIYLTR